MTVVTIDHADIPNINYLEYNGDTKIDLDINIKFILEAPNKNYISDITFLHDPTDKIMNPQAIYDHSV